jgi:hypothetical protein
MPLYILCLSTCQQPINAPCNKDTQQLPDIICLHTAILDRWIAYRHVISYNRVLSNIRICYCKYKLFIYLYLHNCSLFLKQPSCNVLVLPMQVRTLPVSLSGSNCVRAIHIHSLDSIRVLLTTIIIPTLHDPVHHIYLHTVPR